MPITPSPGTTSLRSGALLLPSISILLLLGYVSKICLMRWRTFAVKQLLQSVRLKVLQRPQIVDDAKVGHDQQRKRSEHISWLWKQAESLPGTNGEEEREFAPHNLKDPTNVQYLVVALLPRRRRRKEESSSFTLLRLILWSLLSIVHRTAFGVDPIENLLHANSSVTGEEESDGGCVGTTTTATAAASVEDVVVIGTSMVMGPLADFGPKLCRMAVAGVPVEVVQKHAAIMTDLPSEEVKVLLEKFLSSRTEARVNNSSHSPPLRGTDEEEDSAKTPTEELSHPFPSILAKKPRSATVMDVMVTPSLRGYGIGKALVRASLLVAAEKGGFDALDGAAADHGLVKFYSKLLEDDDEEKESKERGAPFRGRGIYIPITSSLQKLCRRRLERDEGGIRYKLEL